MAPQDEQDHVFSQSSATFILPFPCLIQETLWFNVLALLASILLSYLLLVIFLHFQVGVDLLMCFDLVEILVDFVDNVTELIQLELRFIIMFKQIIHIITIILF